MTKIAVLRQSIQRGESLGSSTACIALALCLALPGCTQPLDLGSNQTGAEGGATQGSLGSPEELTTLGSAGHGATSGVAGQATGGTEPSPIADPEVVLDTNPRDPDCSTPAGWEERTAVDGHLDFEPREIWRGYVSDASWPLPPNDDVVLYVRSRDTETITGAVVFGSGEVPPPATDPLVGYLPASIYDPSHREDSYDDLRLPEVWGGYALSALSGTVEGVRVRLAVTSAEQWRTWCELVAGYSSGICTQGGGGSSHWDCEETLDPWSCEVCYSGDRENDRDVQYQCDKYAICTSQVCVCEDGCCTASTETGRLEFDLRLENDGTELNGTIDTSQGSRNVFLTRDSDT